MHILFHPPHNSSIIKQQIMGLEDIYNNDNNTRLTLSLGSDDVLHHHHQQNKKRSKPSPILSDNSNYLSSLSLGLPWELKFEVVNDNNNNNGSTEMTTTMMNSSQASSESSLKREREIITGDEDELEGDEKGSPRDDVYQDEEVVGTRKKLRLTKEQSVVLEDSFKDHTTLNSKQKQELARKLNLRPRQVEVWFQNRRARTKLKQTEVEYEVLRKCYETLADENRRLQMELQDLKAANQTPTTAPPPFHMAAATLTICPSCERTYGGGASGDNSDKFSLSAGEKSQFYRSFLNPSAAC